jgi:hypothetical protein
MSVRMSVRRSRRRSVRTAALGILGIALGLATACGPSIPEHNGYKSAKVSPWRNPKVIKLDDNREGKADGELDYPTQKRARWYAIDLPSSGDLQVSVEANPQNEGDDFDLGMEIVGPGNRVLAKADLEDEDAHELTKTRSVGGLDAGRVLLHLFLQGRLDNSDFEVKVKFTPKVSEISSDFPAQVAYLPSLATVPVIDDSPESSGRRPTVVRRPTGPRRPTPAVKEVEAPPTTKVSAKVLRATMSDKSTTLILSAGSDAGVADGWRGTVSGVKGISFSVRNVTQRTCKAVIEGVTAEQVNGRTVTLSPP